MATLTDAGSYRAWSSVSVLRPGEVTCLICTFYLSVAARLSRPERHSVAGRLRKQGRQVIAARPTTHQPPQHHNTRLCVAQYVQHVASEKQVILAICACLCPGLINTTISYICSCAHRCSKHTARHAWATPIYSLFCLWLTVRIDIY